MFGVSKFIILPIVTESNEGNVPPVSSIFSALQTNLSTIGQVYLV